MRYEIKQETLVKVLTYVKNSNSPFPSGEVMELFQELQTLPAVPGSENDPKPEEATSVAVTPEVVEEAQA